MIPGKRESQTPFALSAVVLAILVTTIPDSGYAQRRRANGTQQRPQVAKKIQSLQAKAKLARAEGDWPKAVGALNELSKAAKKNRLADLAFNAELEIIAIAGISGGPPSSPDNWINKSAKDAQQLASSSSKHLRLLEQQLATLRKSFHDPTKHSRKNQELTLKMLGTIEERIGSIRGIKDVATRQRWSHSVFFANRIDHEISKFERPSASIYTIARADAEQIAVLNKDSVVIDKESRTKVEKYLIALSNIEQFTPGYDEICQHAVRVMESINRDPKRLQKFDRHFASALIKIIERHASRNEVSHAAAYIEPALRMADRAFAPSSAEKALFLDSLTDATSSYRNQRADRDPKSHWERAATELVTILRDLDGTTSAKTIAAAMKLVTWQHDRSRLDPQRCEQIMSWIEEAGPDREKDLLDCHVFAADHHMRKTVREPGNGFRTWRMDEADAKQAIQHLQSAISLAGRHAPNEIEGLQYRVAMTQRARGNHGEAAEILTGIVTNAEAPYTLIQAESQHVLARVLVISTLVDRGKGLRALVSQQACDAMRLAIEMYDDVYRRQPQLLMWSESTGGHAAENEFMSHLQRLADLSKWRMHNRQRRESQRLLFQYHQFVKSVRKINHEPMPGGEGLMASHPRTYGIARTHIEKMKQLKTFIDNDECEGLSIQQQEVVLADYPGVAELSRLYYEKFLKRKEYTLEDAAFDIRVNNQRIMNNSGIGAWGLIRVIEVNAAGQPTGR